MASDESGMTLKTRSVGRTSLRVSELGFGAASLGNLYRRVTDQAAHDTLEAMWSNGMRYVDTAPYYGLGHSERRIGDFLRSKPRDSFVLSTKVGRRLRPVVGHEGDAERYGFCTPMPFEPVYDYTYDGIMRSYEDSLQRLGLARIDILFVHDIGTVTHGEENAGYLQQLKDGGFKALEELRASGAVDAIGLGVNEWEICVQVMDLCQLDCILLAGRYTLLEQESLDTFFPKCVEHGTSLVIGGAYNSGILATGVEGDTVPYYNYEPAPQAIIDRVRKIQGICRDHSVSLPSAALQFPLVHPLVSSVIPGLGNARRLAQTMGQYTATIPDSFWSDLRDADLLHPAAPTPGQESGA